VGGGVDWQRKGIACAVVNGEAEKVKAVIGSADKTLIFAV